MEFKQIKELFNNVSLLMYQAKIANASYELEKAKAEEALLIYKIENNIQLNAELDDNGNIKR